MNTVMSSLPSSAMSSPTLTMLQPSITTIRTTTNQELVTQERFHQFLNSKVEYSFPQQSKMMRLSSPSPTTTPSKTSSYSYYVNRTPATTSPCLKKRIQMSDKLESHLRQIGFVWNNHEESKNSPHHQRGRSNSSNSNSSNSKSSPSSSSTTSSSSSTSSPWEEYFYQLLKYQKLHGHCNVPGYYPKNQHLSNFVKLCRLQYRQMLLRGRHSIVSVDKMHHHATTTAAASSSNSSSTHSFSKVSSSTPSISRYHHHPRRGSNNGSKLTTTTNSSSYSRRNLVLTLDRIAKLERIGFEWE